MKLISSRAAMVLVAIVALGTTQLPAAPLLVNLTDDATTLAQAITGSGVTLVGTPTRSFQPGQAGTFTNFDSGPFSQTNGSSGQFNIASGILLTTGIASGAEGNYIGGPNFDASGSGNPQLTALSGTDTFDAAVLTIQFNSTNPNLFFSYAFASAEYPAFIGGFSDALAIFVNGINIALVPGTTTPVSINSINADLNSSFFTQYSNPGTPFNYGGVTTLLTARANVSTTSVNTIQIAIADSLDGSLDSAIFIPANSLTAVPEPGGLLVFPAGVALLGALAAYRRRACGHE
ncbi:MAG: choice-of-anchor L domain-containing protein [Bryobacteraceae bacterium]|nr:choice-of-anchor L domain-containing protein [Bryobacteraceae bacterium]